MFNGDKPVGASQEMSFDSLHHFASELGWSELRLCQHTINDSAVAPEPFVTTWYESGEANGGRSDFFLQINPTPTHGIATYAAAVYAMRYRICTGWHSFTLGKTANDVVAEALRLECWLHRKWFDSLARRKQFRMLHPECANYSWARMRNQGPPYPLERPA